MALSMYGKDDLCDYNNCLEKRRHFHNRETGVITILGDNEDCCKNCEIKYSIKVEGTNGLLIQDDTNKIYTYNKHCCGCKKIYPYKIEIHSYETINDDCGSYEGDTTIKDLHYKHCCICGDYNISEENYSIGPLLSGKLWEKICYSCACPTPGIQCDPFLCLICAWYPGLYYGCCIEFLSHERKCCFKNRFDDGFHIDIPDDWGFLSKGYYYRWLCNNNYCRPINYCCASEICVHTKVCRFLSCSCLIKGKYNLQKHEEHQIFNEDCIYCYKCKRNYKNSDEHCAVCCSTYDPKISEHCCKCKKNHKKSNVHCNICCTSYDPEISKHCVQHCHTYDYKKYDHCCKCNKDYEKNQKHCSKCCETYDSNKKHCCKCTNYDPLVCEHCSDCHNTYNKENQKHCSKCCDIYDSNLIHCCECMNFDPSKSFHCNVCHNTYSNRLKSCPKCLLKKVVV